MSPWFSQGLMAQGLEAHYLDPSLCLDGEPDEVGEAAVGRRTRRQKAQERSLGQGKAQHRGAQIIVACGEQTRGGLGAECRVSDGHGGVAESGSIWGEP